MTENELSRIIVDSAFKIHTTLGPGLLESVYEAVLAHELERRGLEVICQQAIPVVYEDVKLELGFRADIIVKQKGRDRGEIGGGAGARARETIEDVFAADGYAARVAD